MASRLWLLPLCVVIGVLYLYFVSAGQWDNWPLYGAFHDLLADGFLAGHLYIPVQPAPELLAAKDPYDMASTGDYWLWDATYYRGRYYAYWGPVPALVQAGAKALLGVATVVGDQYVAFAFLLLSVWFGMLLIERMARRLFDRVPRWAVALSMLTFAFANPALHSVTTASTYHAAIAAAQAFTLGGMVVAFDAVWHAGSERARGWRFVLAGVCWGLAIASRVSLGPTVALIALVTAALAALGEPRRFRRAAWALTLQGIPVVLSVAALLLYNKLRFDDWFEFGSKLQLSVAPFRLSPRYALINLYSYLFRPGVWSCRFPFYFQLWEMEHAFPASFALPGDYQVVEPVVGWLRGVPVTWLIPFAFVLAPRGPGLERRSRRAYLFCLLSPLILASVTGGIVLGLYGATMRYLNDVTNGLVLLGVLGGFTLFSHRFAKPAPTGTAVVFTGPLVASIVLGVLLGYQGYNGHFQHFNPDLDQKIVSALSVCPGIIEEPPRFTP